MIESNLTNSLTADLTGNHTNDRTNGQASGDAQTGRMIAELRLHRGVVYDAHFSPQGDWIVTASADGMAILWPYEMFAPREEILELARRRPPLPLTEEQERRYLP